MGKIFTGFLSSVIAVGLLGGCSHAPDKKPEQNVTQVSVKPVSVKPAPAKSPPVKSVSVKPAPVKSVSVKSTPVKPAPAKPAPVKPAPAKSTPAVQAQPAPYIIQDGRQDLLRVYTAHHAPTPQDKLLATQLNSAIIGATGMNEIKFTTGKKRDLFLQIQPGIRVIDRAGEYWRLKADIIAYIRDSAGKRSYSSKLFSVEAPRTLGQEAAIKKLNTAAAPKVTAWLRKEIARITANELRAAILLIKIPGKERDLNRDNARIHYISQYLGKLPNVVNHEYISLDPLTGTCQFRLVYFRNSYPGGITSAVSVLLNSAPELK